MLRSSLTWMVALDGSLRSTALIVPQTAKLAVDRLGQRLTAVATY